MKVGKMILIVMMVLLFLIGLVVFLYPYIHKAVVDTTLRNDAQEFIDRVTVELWEEETLPEEQEETEPTVPTEPPHWDLLEAMQEYNERIYLEEQESLCDPWSYQQPSFTLGDYGLENEVFGVISIPKLDLEMPLYLGATYQHLADGAAHLSQTSIPIGGNNTNCVIAGHRGWRGASYFRYVTNLKPGDKVTITNLWGSLTYEVTETKIIRPNEVEAIHIQEGRDMVTLLTCHPYASGGKQRFLVFCDRVYEQEEL